MQLNLMMHSLFSLQLKLECVLVPALCYCEEGSPALPYLLHKITKCYLLHKITNCAAKMPWIYFLVPYSSSVSFARFCWRGIMSKC